MKLSRRSDAIYREPWRNQSLDHQKPNGCVTVVSPGRREDDCSENASCQKQNNIVKSFNRFRSQPILCRCQQRAGPARDADPLD
jgi:hypothetical protein